MFQSPKAQTYVAPEEPIDVNQRYLVKVMDLVDQGLSKFAPPDRPYNRIRWVFRMGKLDGTPVLDVDGNAYEHHDYTSNKTGKGSKTATARLWMEALLGPLDDSDIDDTIMERLKGKVAVALLEERPATGDNGEAIDGRVKILRLSPYKPTAAAAPAEAPKPAPKQKEPEPVPF